MADNGLELSTLSNHLWESANILRGPVDAADFKTYIFPLLFFKRISDVFDEEVAEALAESDGDQQYALFPENHRFQIPDDCHWDDVRKKTSNVGQGLQRAMREIEKANALKARQALLSQITDSVSLTGSYTKSQMDEAVKNNRKIVDLACREFDKYGRLLVELYMSDGKKLNDWMVQRGYGYVYNGGTKSTTFGVTPSA